MRAEERQRKNKLSRKRRDKAREKTGKRAREQKDTVKGETIE